MYFTFENPYFLVGLLGLPFILFLHYWFIKHSKSKAMNFANFEALKRISGDRILTRDITHLVLRSTTFILILVTLTGVQLWYSTETDNTDHIIMIDTSSSMLAEDIPPNRLEAAKDYANQYIDLVGPANNVGVLTFSGVIKIDQLPTTEHSDARNAVDSISSTRTGGTDLAGAIIQGTNMLIIEESQGRQLFLVSDGVETSTPYLNRGVQQAVDYARDNQVVINTLGLGSANGSAGFLPDYYNISSAYDGTTLELIANQTEGEYIRRAVNASIAAAVNTDEVELEQTYAAYNISSYAGLLALILLFVEWVIANTIYRRVI